MTAWPDFLANLELVGKLPSNLLRVQVAWPTYAKELLCIYNLRAEVLLLCKQIEFAFGYVLYHSNEALLAIPLFAVDRQAMVPPGFLLVVDYGILKLQTTTSEGSSRHPKRLLLASLLSHELLQLIN